MCSHILGGVRYFESYTTGAYCQCLNEHAVLAVVDYSNTISQAE